MTTRRDAPITYLYGEVYRAPNGEEHAVTDRQHWVLQTFIGRPVLKQAELEKISGLENHAAPVLRDLVKDYNGDFASAIRLPGGKGKGGFRVRVTANEVVPIR